MKLVKSLFATAFGFSAFLETQVEGKLQLQAGSNQAEVSKKAHNQKGGTCYAHACASVIRAAQKRNKLDYKSHEKLRKRIIKKFGDEGANPDVVLKHYCKRFRLKFDKIAPDEATSAITKGNRPLVMGYYTDDGQHEFYTNFYSKDPKAILTRKDVDNAKGGGPLGGHAVTLVGQSSEGGYAYWKCKNSWSRDFGDKGHFRFQKHAFNGCGVMPNYWDVYKKGEARFKETGGGKNSDGTAFQYEPDLASESGSEGTPWEQD